MSLAVLVTVAASACGGSTTTTDDSLPLPQPVATAPDGAPVLLTGVVTSASPDGFILEYGEGEIRVEMDDWDSFPEGRYILENDDVIVYGFVDDDFFESRTVEAYTVYVRDLGTQFYASGYDEESLPALALENLDPRIELTGTVEDVAGDRFVLDTGAGNVDVDVRKLNYDPLDDEGFQKISQGDRVRVVGEIGDRFFTDLDIEADRVITLQTSGIPGTD